MTASSRVSGRSSFDVPLQTEGGEAQRPPGKQGHCLRLAPQSVPVLGSALDLTACQGQLSGMVHAYSRAAGSH